MSTTSDDQQSTRSATGGPSPSRHGGRRRNEEARRAILDAAYTSLVEGGFNKTSIEEIARRAGAGKSTVYRWWKSKAALLLDAVHEREITYPTFQYTGDPRTDLRNEVRAVLTFYAGETGSATLDLFAEARFDDVLHDELMERFIKVRRDFTTEFFRRAGADGLVRKGLAVDVVMDSIWGAVYYRLLVMRVTPDLDYADRLIETVWPSLAPER
ncbi:TetR/AcrR family transcriptional regulator [Millisia brevis]|uniref:TetR/AcrR family transcriptional regulator n=1 Tax=Millisia brevis TaxID=264148 RepID=UPI0014724D1F|nr:TetR/AcrR family transcriptional regulator [Millisia brevis]